MNKQTHTHKKRENGECELFHDCQLWEDTKRHVGVDVRYI